MLLPQPLNSKTEFKENIFEDIIKAAYLFE